MVIYEIYLFCVRFLQGQMMSKLNQPVLAFLLQQKKDVSKLL
jgi:hypothetical protein